MQRAVLNENGCNRPLALVELSLYYSAARLPCRIGKEFLHFCDYQDIFKKLVYALTRLAGNEAYGNIAAPFFGNEVVLHEFLLNLIGICAGFIYFIYGNYYRNVCRLCMVYRFDCLRHYAVVCRNDKDNYIGNLCAARAHCRECLVSRRIYESYAFSAYSNRIRTDMLGDAACFACGDVLAADIVQK